MSDGVPAPAIVTAGSAELRFIASLNRTLAGVEVETFVEPFAGTVDCTDGLVESISKSAGEEEFAVFDWESASSARTLTFVESIEGEVHA